MYSIAISTISNRIETLDLTPYDDIQYVIVHQETHQASPDAVKALSARPDVIYVPLDKKGLSVSRNTALANATGDYVLIMDDDVTFSIDAIHALHDHFKEDDIDVATYYHKFTNGKTTLKKQSAYNHHLLNIANPSSIDICIKNESLLKSNIQFDESFGLGAQYPSGEEMIFLADCLKFGLKVKRYPLEICTHPPVTSGADFFTTKQKILAKAAMFNRIYSKFGRLLFILFVLKKTPKVCQAGYGKFFILNAISSLIERK
ncbi:glycosyltransferase family 2 protein [Shewanella oncorhynchi]|uniref:glycosyltransferase family 2 protein n=1 Tax=Shewanella oncorhynchi TaxID=2726434 RepID=UPI003D7B1A6C